MELQWKRDSWSIKGGGEEETEVGKQSRSGGLGNNLLTVAVVSRRPKTAQPGKGVSSLLWNKESSREWGHSPKPAQEGRWGGRLTLPPLQEAVSPSASTETLGSRVEWCKVTWCHDFSILVAKALGNQWVLFSFKWQCLLKAICICVYFNVFRFHRICTVVTGTLPLQHWQAPFYPLVDAGSPFCPLQTPTLQGFCSICGRTPTWGCFTAEKKWGGKQVPWCCGVPLAARKKQLGFAAIPD